MYEGWIGIDPGKDGALARVYSGGNEFQIHDTPTSDVVIKKKGKNVTRRQYDPAAMAHLLQKLIGPPEVTGPGSVLVVIEKQNAGIFGMRGGRMQTMGVTSAFSTGEGYGLWQGIAAAFGCPVLLVHPARWKRVLMDGMPKTKEASVPAATRLYPRSAPDLRGPRGRSLHGRADALLLAHYGRIKDQSFPVDPDDADDEP